MHFVTDHRARPVRGIALASALALGLGLAPALAQDDTQAGNGDSPAVPVTYSEVRKQDISRVQVYSGRVEAIDTVELVARVQGYVETRDFQEGQLVKKGDLLFRLDQSLYMNAVEQAQAAVGTAQAQLTLAEQQYGRQQELTARDVQSVARLDEATAARDSAQSGLLSARAQLEQANINLGYTEIRAPIDGLAGRALASVGDLVSSAAGPLVTIVSQDPMYVTFPVPQATMLEIRRRQQSGDSVQFELGLPDGSIYTSEGAFAFANNQATASTDSLLVRVSVPNPDGLLIDQTLVDVRVTSREAVEELTVPQQSLLLDQEGSYVLVVDQDNKVQRKRIKTGVQRNGFIVATEGLDEGDKVIVDGLQKVQPGAEVKPSPADGADASAAGN